MTALLAKYEIGALSENSSIASTNLPDGQITSDYQK
jgi:hypothetical protein